MIRDDMLVSLSREFEKSKESAVSCDVNVNDLVLTPHNTREVQVYARDRGLSQKLSPKWSLPFRVIRVAGTRVTVRSPFDGTVR